MMCYAFFFIGLRLSHAAPGKLRVESRLKILPWNLVIQKKNVTLQSVSACGEIGRRARLRIWYREMCRFESYHAHAYSWTSISYIYMGLIAGANKEAILFRWGKHCFFLFSMFTVSSPRTYKGCWPERRRYFSATRIWMSCSRSLSINCCTNSWAFSMMRCASSGWAM